MYVYIHICIDINIYIYIYVRHINGFLRFFLFFDNWKYRIWSRHPRRQPEINTIDKGTASCFRVVYWRPSPPLAPSVGRRRDYCVGVCGVVLRACVYPTLRMGQRCCLTSFGAGHLYLCLIFLYVESTLTFILREKDSKSQRKMMASYTFYTNLRTHTPITTLSLYSICEQPYRWNRWI